MSDYFDSLFPDFEQKSKAKKAENQTFFKRLKRVDQKVLDKQMHQLHEEVFACTDCLKCANCCKTTGPLLTPKDVERIAKRERMKSAQFIEHYLRIDEDGDYVFKSMPCPFLADDNMCNIYDVRPKACREFPHTDRNKQFQILNITRKNTEVCPAVFEITERLKKAIPVVTKEKTKFK